MHRPNLKWKIAQTLEYKWWQRYLRKKQAGEYLEWKRNYWSEILERISPDVSLTGIQQIMDAGCGPAGIFMILNDHAVTAVDPLLHKYTELKHFDQANYPWTSFQNQPLETFQQKEVFDTIFCMNAINHVNDIELCYDNLVGALKPGGTIVITTDCHRSKFLKKIFQLLPGDMLHPVQLDLQEYNKLLTARGMEIVNNICYNRKPIFDYHIMIAVKK